MRGRGFLTYPACLIALIAVAVACGRDPELRKAMDRAEAVMNEHPDSALRILETHRPAENAPKSDLARHSLLTSMARDKNVIDDTTFNILSPAIDYYICQGKGSPDERLRASYYQGRIYMNRKEYGAAMKSYQQGRLLEGEVSDSLTLANLIYGQGTLYYTAHRIREYGCNNKEAAGIYHKLGKTGYEIDCLNNIGRAAIMMDDRATCDSVEKILSARIETHPEFTALALPVIVGCKANFATGDTLRKIADQYKDSPEITDFLRIELSSCYLQTDEPLQAVKLMEEITDPIIMQSRRYREQMGLALYQAGRYAESARAFSESDDASREWLEMLYTNNLSFADEYFSLEQENERNIEARRHVVAISITLGLLLVLVIVLISLRLKYNRQKSKSQELANENLKYQVASLETERDRLLRLSEMAADVNPAVKKVLEGRLKAINNLMAFQISNNKCYEKAYEEWKERMFSDRAIFMKENRIAMASDHPAFIRKLEDAGLTEAEIEYACLYALGLTGREIGAFLQYKRHYHLSCEIRKKLGMEDNPKILSKYIMSLLK